MAADAFSEILDRAFPLVGNEAFILAYTDARFQTTSDLVSVTRIAMQAEQIITRTREVVHSSETITVHGLIRQVSTRT